MGKLDDVLKAKQLANAKGGKLAQYLENIDSELSKLMPANARMLSKSVVNPSPINEGMFTKEELDVLRQAYINAQQRSHGKEAEAMRAIRNPSVKSNDPLNMIDDIDLSKEPMPEWMVRKVTPTIQYEDYPLAKEHRNYGVGDMPISASFNDPAYAMSTTIGRAKHYVDKDGNVHVIDTYDFPSGHNMKEYDTWSPAFKALHTYGERFSKKMPVDINIGKFDKGGRASLDDEFKMNELQGQSALGKLTSAAKKAYQDYRNNPDVPLNYLLKGNLPGTGRAAAKGLAKSLERIGSDPMEVANYATPLGGAAGVVKNVGGQWLPTELNRLNRELSHVTSNPDVTNWLNTAGKKYIINRAGTPADELRMLADKGITHMDPKSLERTTENLTSRENRATLKDIVRNRLAAGYPAEGLATTDLGRQWELKSDFHIDPYSAELLQGNESMVKELPWLTKLSPEESVYGHTTSATAENLGMHDLAKAIEKDLASGKLKPEQLHKLTVEEAAKRAHGHRAEAEAAAKTLNKQLPAVKEYPTGFKWHELTHPDEDTLSSILNKEGQEMQNCIKGYTSAVMEDGTRLFSLRDPAGKSHVNIELKPEAITKEDIADKFGEEQATHIMDMLSPKEIAKAYPELSQYRINQVKGKQNAAPVEDYLPYVQDFVKNPIHGNDFKEVRDFHNTGLLDLNRLKEHGLLNDTQSPIGQKIESELVRIFPSEKNPYGGSVLSGQHGLRLAPYDMMTKSVKDLEGKYITPEELHEHLTTQETRPVEHGYSKYWKSGE